MLNDIISEVYVKKILKNNDFLMVRPRRLELPRIAPQAPQACVSTNSTMAASGKHYTRLFTENQVLAFVKYHPNCIGKEVQCYRLNHLIIMLKR